MADPLTTLLRPGTRPCDALDAPQGERASDGARRAGLTAASLRAMNRDDAAAALTPAAAARVQLPTPAPPVPDGRDGMSLLSLSAGVDQLGANLYDTHPSALGRTGSALGALSAVDSTGQAIASFRRPGGHYDGAQHTADAIFSGLGATRNPILGALSTGYSVGQWLDKATGAEPGKLTGLSGLAARGIAATDPGLRERARAHEAAAPVRARAHQTALLERQIAGQERALEGARSETARGRIQQNLDRLRAELDHVTGGTSR